MKIKGWSANLGKKETNSLLKLKPEHLMKFVSL